MTHQSKHELHVALIVGGIGWALMRMTLVGYAMYSGELHLANEPLLDVIVPHLM